MQASRKPLAMLSLGLIVVFLLPTFTAGGARSEYPLPPDLAPTAYADFRFATKEATHTAVSTPWKYDRECEHPDEYTVGRMIPRSNASEKEVHGQFGCEEASGYPAKAGYVKYVGINTPQIDTLYLRVRYSKYSISRVPIEVFIDDELRASFDPVNQGSWNVFTSTNAITLGSVYSGVHSIMFSTEGQQYGVADLDAFTLTNYLTSSYQVSLPLVVKEAASWAENRSYSTTCAEEDNVNVPIFAYQISRFEVVATHPTYDIGVDNCEPDFSGCTTAAVQTADTCTHLLDDGTNIVTGCNVAGWWRPYRMNIVVGSNSGSYHYLILYRKIQGAGSWPQFLVLYEDGYMRLKPHPPVGRSDTCFGSSVIIGPATPSSRPYVDIQEVRVNPDELSLDLTYRNGGTAHIDLSVDRSQSVAVVDVDYSTSTSMPFATFRSMYVSDGNADADHIQTLAGDFPITTGWTTLEGPWWFFHRTVRSVHNTSAPDIQIEMLD